MSSSSASVWPSSEHKSIDVGRRRLGQWDEHSVVYDSDRHRMLVFGGSDYAFLNEVWALSLDDLTWVQLQTMGTPPSPREEQSMIYDPVRKRLVLFGGYDNLSFVGSQDTWELTLDSQPQWRELTPGGPTPIYRWGHAAVYDRERDRMVMHGGLGPGLDETWALTWSQPQTAVPALTNVEVLAGEVRLTWSLFGGSPTRHRAASRFSTPRDTGCGAGRWPHSAPDSTP